MLEQVATSSGINFKTECDDIDKLFTPEDEVTFYRIVQECVSNIVKHSKAKNAQVFIKKVENQISVKISDDGIGFVSNDEEFTEKRVGFGLKGIEERVRMLSGKLEIQSKNDVGTAILINFQTKQKIGRAHV